MLQRSTQYFFFVFFLALLSTKILSSNRYALEVWKTGGTTMPPTTTTGPRPGQLKPGKLTQEHLPHLRNPCLSAGAAIVIRFEEIRKKESGMKTLARELWQEIISYLDLHELVGRAQLVCVLWAEMASLELKDRQLRFIRNSQLEPSPTLGFRYLFEPKKDGGGLYWFRSQRDMEKRSTSSFSIAFELIRWDQIEPSPEMKNQTLLDVFASATWCTGYAAQHFSVLPPPPIHTTHTHPLCCTPQHISTPQQEELDNTEIAKLLQATILASKEPVIQSVRGEAEICQLIRDYFHY